jgi:hypothetical protein
VDKTYVLLLFAAKPSDVYVALSKTNLEKAREYLILGGTSMEIRDDRDISGRKEEDSIRG